MIQSKSAHDVKMACDKSIYTDRKSTLRNHINLTDATGTAGGCHRLYSLSDELKRAKHSTITSEEIKCIEKYILHMTDAVQINLILDY